AFFEVGRLKNLTLPEMNWVETGRLDENGVTVIAGTFDAFDWNTFDSGENPIRLRWLQRAVLFLPPNYPNNTNPGDRAATRGVLYNRHDGNPAGEPLYTVWGVEFARNFNVPVLIHGWSPALTHPAGFNSVHEMQFPLLKLFLRRRFCKWGDVPIDGSYAINGNILVKGDLVAITLLQRLAQQEGGKVKKVGSLGISKEGNSHWTLAAVDDRVEIVAPGGHYAEDIHRLAQAYYTDWGAKNRFQSGVKVNFTKLFLRLEDWYRSTELGGILDRISNAANFQDQIYSDFVLISGDTTLAWQHDKAFPLGAETHFLRRFGPVPWRYVRIPDGSGILLDGNLSQRAASLLPMVADKLLAPKAPAPAIQQVWVETSNDRRFRVHAVQAPLPTLALSLWAATSKNRWWTQVVQGSWVESSMSSSGSSQWVSDWSAPIPGDEAVAFFIEARTIAQYGSYWFYRIDTSQPHFLWPRPSLDPFVRLLWGVCR
ncbi:MAG: hypothetical protein ACE5H3_05880, partial [Planctomycetota bacterium]